MLQASDGGGARSLLRGTRSIERFATQTELLARFSQLSGIVSLSIENGAGSFFDDFREYMDSPVPSQPTDLIAMPIDPTDFLAFPSGGEELRLAVRRVGGTDIGAALDVLAERYGLTPSQLNQPIRTLSGGERALVALAKADALMSGYAGAVFASPVTWLHSSRRHLVTELCERFEESGKPTHLLLLDGDWPEVDQTLREYEVPADLGKVTWRLCINGVTLTFPATGFPNRTEERKIRFKHSGAHLQLVSPTLIQGENGIGKSSLALALSGIIEPEQGRPEVIASGNAGNSRLLLQDTMRQMFGMSSIDHVHSVYRYDEERRKSVSSALDNIDQELRRAHSDFALAFASLDKSGRPSSLLHGKLALAMERLVACPSLLILDEPLWGLSDKLAREFVHIIVREAHNRQVPVAVISHEQSWLQHLYNSAIVMRLTENNEVEVSANAL